MNTDHDLLIALVDLDERTRDLDDRRRSVALAIVGGTLRAVAYREVPSATAVALLAEFSQMLARVADPAEVTQ